MLKSGDLKSLKHKILTYNKRCDIGFGFGGRFRDAVPTRAVFLISITEKAITLYFRWSKRGSF